MIELTRTGKNPLVIENPVMPAAGTFGFDGAPYQGLIDLSKLGALVTNPVSWKPRRVARGPRIVPLPAGVLVHTGLPNPGAARAIRHYGRSWARSLAPVIVHVVATTPDDVARCAEALAGCEGVAGIELGLHDQADADEIAEMLHAAQDAAQIPVLARVPLHNALDAAIAAEDAGAGGVVVAAPPRGTARDPDTGRLVGGRVYGPWLAAQCLRAVGQVAGAIQVPVIGSGGIHTPDNARDFLEAGAVAVQVDTVIWSQPQALEVIARNLGGLELTRATGALADEWQPGLGETELLQRQRRESAPPGSLPETPDSDAPPPTLPE